MQLALVLLGSLLGLVSIAALGALRLELDLRMLGGAEGSLFLAFGVDLGLLTLAGVWTRSGPGRRLELRVLGRRVDLGRRSSGIAGRARPRKRALGARARKALRGVTVSDWIDLALGRIARIESLDVGVDYGFSDVALTGRIYGALQALSVLLPASVSLRQTPRWVGEESFEVTARGSLRVWPGRALGRLGLVVLRARGRPAAVGMRMTQEPA